MKCWKCGKEIPEGASMCTYCSASMNRKAPATPAGKAMRQIYDRFGSGRVFDKKSILSIALGDMLEDSKKIRSQIDMVMSAGVGGVYLNQLQNVGKPDSAFCNKIKKLMTDEAGLSDKVAAELMGYFDEMIGWAVSTPAAAQTNPQPSGGSTSGGAASGGAASGGAASRPASNKEIPRPTPGKEIPRPTPTAANYASAAAKIPLPTAPIPKFNVGCRESLMEWMYLATTCLCIMGGVALISTGLIPIAIVPFVLAVIIFKALSNRLDHLYPGQRKINRKKSANSFDLSWEGPMDKFAIAVGDKWVCTGSGSQATLTENMLAHIKTSGKIEVTLAEITASGIELRGTSTFYR